MECQFLYCGDILELLLRLHSVPDKRLSTNFYREFFSIRTCYLSLQDHPVYLVWMFHAAFCIDNQFLCFF